MYGSKLAHEFWKASVDAIDLIEEIVDEHSIDSVQAEPNIDGTTHTPFTQVSISSHVSKISRTQLSPS